MGQITPTARTVAESLADNDVVRYAVGNTKFHDSGNVIEELHIQVKDTPSAISTVENMLVDAGYTPNRRGTTDYEPPHQIIEATDE